jgi:2-polyprenyl-3-methyl-5-hydroxy-6-metoxy-1,4-benzoquinol methylase
MNIYGAFASVYDIMQYDIDYENWIEQIKAIAGKYSTGARSMLELACGTGTIGIGLSKKGYLVEALDLSEDMLTVAQSKAYDAGVKMRFYHQDMVSFNTKKTYDVIFCMCDGLNYILDEASVGKVFENVIKHLNPGGLFICDLSSKYKLKEIIGNRTFAETFDQAAYIWENEFDALTNQLAFTLTLFIEEDDGYQRFEEFHTQKAHENEAVLAIANQNFNVLEILDGDTFEVLQETSQRVCFIMKRKI